MTMNDVEVVGMLENLSEHRHVIAEPVGGHLRES